MSIRPAWLQEAELQQFFAATKDAGGEARVVGGAVRDTLMGIEGGDVDVASTLLPEQTIALCNAAGWKVIPTGIDHGTVTVVLPTRTVEVTTLRRDVETDGRRAVVAYTDRFEEDAARRDFTMNALYMDAAGTLYDYFNGQKDAQARAVRFIGDATTRIHEDGLRILRFFRFLATHGAAPADAAALEAIRQNVARIEPLSGERIAAEMRKLLGAANPAYALSQMQTCGVHILITQQGWEQGALEKLLQHEVQHQQPLQWTVRLLALIAPPARAIVTEWVSARWKLSRAERQELQVLSAVSPTVTAAEVKEWLRAEPREQVLGKILLAQVDVLAEEQAAALIRLCNEWQVPVFPVTAADLIARGHREGKALGDALRALEKQWVESDYSLSKQILLESKSIL